MAVRVHVAISKTLEEWWGADELLADMAGADDEAKRQAVIEFVMEDFPAFVDNATWTMTILDDDKGRQQHEHS